MTVGNSVELRLTIRETILRATLALDDQRWDDWLGLCDESFQYSINSYSPEISRDMTYMHKTRAEMKSMVDLLAKHNTDHSPLTRHTSVYTVDLAADGRTAKAVSSVIVYQNLLDGEHSHFTAGESRLFMVGRYIDELKIEGATARFTKREVRLQNRRFDKGSHWPI